MTKWEERLLEIGLEEILGESTSAGSRHAPPVPRRRGPANLLWLSAAAVALAVTVWSLADEPPSRAVDIAVHVGELHVASRTESRLAAPMVQTVELRPGATLTTPMVTAFTLGGSRRFTATSDTKLEVLTMNRIETRTALVSTVTLAVVAGAITWGVLGESGHATTGDKVDVAIAATGDRVAALQRENDELRRELAAARANQARRALDGKARGGGAETVPAPRPEASRSAGLVFHDERFAAEFAKIDWSVFGAAIHKSLGLMEQGVQQLLDGGDPPIELFSEIEVLSAKMQEQLQKLTAANYARSGENGAFTQPSVQANILAAILREAGRDLSTAQVQDLSRIVDYYRVKDSSQTRGERSWLASMLEQYEDRRAFAGEMRRVLSSAQRDAITSEHLRGCNQDLLGGDLLLRPYTRRLQANDAGEFGKQVAFHLEQELGIAEAGAGALRKAVRAWSAALPAELFAAPSRMEKLGVGNLIAGDRAWRATQRQVELLRRVLRDVTLSSAQRKKLLDLRRLFVPVPR